jgi:hypothetical protein
MRLVIHAELGQVPGSHELGGLDVTAYRELPDGTKVPLSAHELVAQLLFVAGNLHAVHLVDRPEIDVLTGHELSPDGYPLVEPFPGPTGP